MFVLWLTYVSPVLSYTFLSLSVSVHNKNLDNSTINPRTRRRERDKCYVDEWSCFNCSSGILTEAEWAQPQRDSDDDCEI